MAIPRARYQGCRARAALSVVAALLVAGRARADPPDFDRPGAGFATSVLPMGGIALEQGLPTYSRFSADAVTDRQLSADSLLRVGLGDIVEVQFGEAFWNRLRESTGSTHREVTGHSDSSVAIKLAPASFGDFAWAALAQVTLANGDADFSNGATQYSLGATGQWQVSERVATTLYANVDRLRGRDTWTLAPTVGLRLGEGWVAYVEADAVHDPSSGEQWRVGGGVARTIGDHMQLDAYALHRVGGSGPIVIAGLGVSLYFGPTKR